MVGGKEGLINKRKTNFTAANSLSHGQNCFWGGWQESSVPHSDCTVPKKSFSSTHHWIQKKISISSKSNQFLVSENEIITIRFHISGKFCVFPPNFLLMARIFFFFLRKKNVFFSSTMTKTFCTNDRIGCRWRNCAPLILGWSWWAVWRRSRRSTTRIRFGSDPQLFCDWWLRANGGGFGNRWWRSAFCEFPWTRIPSVKRGNFISCANDVGKFDWECMKNYERDT